MKSIFHIFWLLSFFLLESAGGVEAAVITVRSDGSGDYPTIQEAINAANPHDTIVLERGVYRGAGNRDLDFNGKALIIRSADPSDPAGVAATVIDCQGTAADLHRGFHFHSGESADSAVEGLVITSSDRKICRVL
jgi:ethanolamine utilization microcompartment shell protein EutL